jgi:hypothetical protein
VAKNLLKKHLLLKRQLLRLCQLKLHLLKLLQPKLHLLKLLLLKLKLLQPKLHLQKLLQQTNCSTFSFKQKSRLNVGFFLTIIYKRMMRNRLLN